ncbi:DinB family protein [Hymenobacter sp. NST-14]|uniref:DinB family protein n=1 Tax=Hymenobacter piscis TaxID=2839984 RepID=UPI001C024B56|nr:DinB family protein [Hymenobacter piscis]MBT9393190.1 DinB family protein [Hymenobacter piscis]
MHQVCHRLHELLTLLNSRLPLFSVVELTSSPGPGKWSRKQILGHLIDSAVNNHRRFVLALTEPEPLVLDSYNQDAWVQCADYQHTPLEDLLSLWTTHNRQLIRLIERIPPAAHAHRCTFDNGFEATLHWLVEDYAVHLEHHVQQLLDRTPR